MPQGVRNVPPNYKVKDVRQNNINKPKAINVFLLPADGEKININETGLIGLSLDRYVSNPNAMNTGILQTLDITLFTRSTKDISGYLAENSSNLRLQYGFEEEELSPVYDLQVLKLKTTKSDAGTMFALGAVGIEEHRKFPEEVYKQGIMIEDILKSMAERNGWEQRIDCKIRTPKPLIKKKDETDFEFILNKLVPLTNQTIIQDTREKTKTVFWETKLFKEGSQVILYFKPRNKGIQSRRVWSYEYGTSANNSIININQEMDLTYFLRGLSIQVSASILEQSIYTEETLKELINEMKDSISLEIKEIHDKYNIPMLNIDRFAWRVELVEADEEDSTDVLTELNYDSLRTRIISAIDKAVSAAHTLEIEVVGNPEILPTDLIELLIKDLDGTYDWMTAPGGVSSYWRVVGINENIGLSGYTTKLQLVREFIVE